MMRDIWWVLAMEPEIELENWTTGHRARMRRDRTQRAEPTWQRVEEALPGQVVLITGLQWLNQHQSRMDPASRVEILRIEADPDLAQRTRSMMRGIV